jgi:hypothetical protein
MIAGTLVAIAIILGYAVAVSLSMAVTFGITKMVPAFVVNDHLLKASYKLFQDFVWLLCVVAGALVAAAVAASTAHLWLVELLLAAGLVCVPWTNAWDVRQRGILHQIVMSAITVVGVAAAFALWKQ